MGLDEERLAIIRGEGPTDYRLAQVEVLTTVEALRTVIVMPDPAFRKAAVARLLSFQYGEHSETAGALLVGTIISDPDPSVRSTALAGHLSSNLLRAVLQGTSDLDIQTVVIRNLLAHREGALEFAMHAPTPELRLEAAKIANNDELQTLLHSAPDLEVRLHAARTIDFIYYGSGVDGDGHYVSVRNHDDYRLARFVADNIHSHPDQEVRLTLVDRIRATHLGTHVSSVRDPAVRRRIIKHLEENDAALTLAALSDPIPANRLAAIAKAEPTSLYPRVMSDPEVANRCAAVRRFVDADNLTQILYSDSSSEVQEAAIVTLTTARLTHKVKRYPYGDIHEELLSESERTALLVNLAKTHPSEDVQVAIASRIADNGALLDLTTNHPSERVRIAAAKQSNDDGMMVHVVLGPYPEPERLAMLARLRGQDTLQRVVKESKDVSVVVAASDRLHLSQTIAPTLLARIVRMHPDESRKLAVLEHITDGDTLVSLFCSDRLPQPVRLAALERMANNNNVAKAIETIGDDNSTLVSAAIKKLDIRLTTNLRALERIISLYPGQKLGDRAARRVLELGSDIDEGRLDQYLQITRRLLWEYPNEEIQLAALRPSRESWDKVVREHPSFHVRLSVVKQMDTSSWHRESLLRVIRDHTEEAIQLEAVKRVIEPQYSSHAFILRSLTELAITHPKKSVQLAIVTQISVMAVHDDESPVSAGTEQVDALERIVLTHPDKEVKLVALGLIVDALNVSANQRYERIAAADIDMDVRTEAITKLTNDTSLARVAFAVTDKTLQSLAVSRISDARVLKELFLKHPDEDIRSQALAQISDTGMLWRMQYLSLDSIIRRAAGARRATVLNPLAGDGESVDAARFRRGAGSDPGAKGRIRT